MIPYVSQPKLELGPLTVYAFGAMVALAILLAARLLGERSRELGLDADRSARLLTWVIVGGFLGAHLVDRLAYFPGATLADPWSLLRVWSGLSSFGGFVGGVAGAWLWIRRERPGPDAWRHLDALAFTFPFAWVLGRLGCFVAFDHPGVATRFFLGQEYLDGVVRHNLGLEEALAMVPLALLFALLGQRRRAPGFFVALLALAYGPVRFVLDFMRLDDVRYLGLTPGQYGAVALTVAGAVLLERTVLGTRASEARPRTAVTRDRARA